jgi:lipopolysaccharide transport system permease protein
MSASYLNPRVQLDKETQTVHAEFEIRNDSGETWRAAEGFRVGHHLFDAETGNLIVDGARAPLGRDLGPGESTSVCLEFAVPVEPGRYRAVLSAMRENVGWYYANGWPCLVVEWEKASPDQLPRLERVRVTRQTALRRESQLRALGRAFLRPVLTIWRNRALIRVMVRRDILGRYRGSFAGSFWTVINPLLLMLTYFFVFGYLIRDPGRSPTEFAVYFLAGMLPWLPFSEATGRAPGVILEHRSFVKKLVFAVETLPVNLVVSGLVTEMFAVLLFCGLLLALRHGVPLTVLWLPVLLVPQALFTAGVSWFLAGLGAFVRDLGQIIGFVLTAWFFMTPICYPEEMLASKAPILTKNPMYILVRAYRAIFLENHAPALGAMWKFSLLAAAVFVLGHAWFYKLKKSFADMI